MFVFNAVLAFLMMAPPLLSDFLLVFFLPMPNVFERKICIFKKPAKYEAAFTRYKVSNSIFFLLVKYSTNIKKNGNSEMQ